MAQQVSRMHGAEFGEDRKRRKQFEEELRPLGLRLDADKGRRGVRVVDDQCRELTVLIPEGTPVSEEQRMRAQLAEARNSRPHRP